MLSKYYDWYWNRNACDTERKIKKRSAVVVVRDIAREPRDGCVDNKVKLLIEQKHESNYNCLHFFNLFTSYSSIDFD